MRRSRTGLRFLRLAATVEDQDYSARFAPLPGDSGTGRREALEQVARLERLPAAGLPPAHVGVAAGPVVAQGGGYFGRTVNLAARIAAHAGPGQVLVSERVAEAGLPAGVVPAEAGEVRLKGFARPVRLLQASRR